MEILLQSNNLTIEYYINKLYSFKRFLSIDSINPYMIRLEKMFANEKDPLIVVFITGTSGSGKSAIVPKLKAALPLFDVHDFDEFGVPVNVDISWRLETTDKWLKIAKENFTIGKSTIISGTSIPDEIYASLEFQPTIDVRFGLLKVKKSTIHERLLKRGWDQETIDDYKNWQKTLIDEVKITPNHCIINGEQSLDDIISEIKTWLS